MDIAEDQSPLSDSSDDFSKLYVVCDLLKDVELTRDVDTEPYITCVEIWDGNLYVGTSQAEILHFVQLSSSSASSTAANSFILASRHQITSPHHVLQVRQGVQQIVLLPNVSKACILANGSLTFYTLPELSPLTTTKPINCTWVGGIEQDSHPGSPDGDIGNDSNENAVIMICAKSRIRLVNIAGEPKKVRDIEYGGCIATSRQYDLACVADAHAYALLDLEYKQKIPLFPICSVDSKASDDGGTHADIVSNATLDDRGHGRTGSFQSIAANFKKRPESPGTVIEHTGSEELDPSIVDESRLKESLRKDTQLALSNNESDSNSKSNRASAELRTAIPLLQPHIAIASPSEFLVTVGTKETDPGVGMFVNHDGDVVRSTIKFSNYPNGVVVDRDRVVNSMSASIQDSEDMQEDGFVLAVTQRKDQPSSRPILEIHSLDPEEKTETRESFIDLDMGEDATGTQSAYGIRRVKVQEIIVSQIYSKLHSRRLDLSLSLPDNNSAFDEEYEMKRMKEEQAFMRNLCSVNARTVLWSGRNIYWVMRTPMILRLDYRLSEFMPGKSKIGSVQYRVNNEGIHEVINSIDGQIPQTEIDYLGLTYIRQKAALLLLQGLIIKTADGIEASIEEIEYISEVLMDSQVDPRIVLMMIPQYCKEVIQSRKGIWVSNGLIEIIDSYNQHQILRRVTIDNSKRFDRNIVSLLKIFLTLWRKKKGFGSVVDEKDVFNTVDAALLHVLLELDKRTPKGPAKAGSVRAELNAIVDHGVDCLDRAVALLEQYKRLYILSRLYQCKRLSSKVLSTWKRIMEGEEDTGGELTDVENEIKKYLTRVKDVDTVTEYGIWLAQKKSALGVQVFADDNSRVRFDPIDVVNLLKERAPSALKDYLEYLVFTKKHNLYINDLLMYYLDTVLNELEKSEVSRVVLLQTYDNYRALSPPKLTYRQFITENTDGSEWWESRLRLLQLLGARHSKDTPYNVAAVLERVQPFEQELVPEMIILAGRQNMHEEALKLLTRNLGDFDTAIRYCLLGGSSLFHADGTSFPQDELPSKEEQSRLLKKLLLEFFMIEDLPSRLERTEELLQRFGGWFDAAEVLEQVPDSWSLSHVSEFLVGAFRRITEERCETVITKSLSECQSLKVTATVIEKLELLKPKVETAG